MRVEIIIRGKLEDHIQAEYTCDDKDLMVAFLTTLVTQMAIKKDDVPERLQSGKARLDV